jgi:hypothetical protein
MDNQTIESVPVPFELMEWVTNLNAQWLLITIFSLGALVILTSQLRTREPWSLSDPIPRVWNTIQFLTNNEKFMKRVM